ncbi:Dipeptide and tripeptide permease A [Cedecea neteri]|nr:Dipeptide and tripeptide permease A [Cedecea neteri]
MAWLFKRLRDRGVRIDIPAQFASSLFCMGVGMLVLPLGISLAGADGMVALKWIVLSYILQSIGELLISPVGYSMIGKLAPANLQGLMMGCWMMVTGVASVLAGYVSGRMPQNNGSTPVLTDPGYSKVFSQLGWGSVATGVILLLLIPLLRRLIEQKNTAQA